MDDGWLTDLAKKSGHGSLRALALRMKDSAYWPSGRKPESVANKLRDLDKGRDTRWWLRTGAKLLPAIAEQLHMSEDEFLELISRLGERSGDGSGLWRVSYFPDLKPIDLGREMPFAGVPQQLQRPGGPSGKRTWWVAPPGAGASLMARWLEHRYGWKTIRAQTWSDVVLPDVGRVFVQLAQAPSSPMRAAEGLDLCVACPTPPFSPRGKDTDEARGSAPDSDAEPRWVVVEPSAPDQWLDSLITWVGARVPSGGGFDVAKVRSLLGKAEYQGLFETPGDVLEFLSVVDHVGVEALDEAAPASLRPITVWLKAALADPARRPEQLAGLLEEHGSEIIYGIVVAGLRRGLGFALPRETWAELVPREFAPDFDPMRLRRVLEEKGADGLDEIRGMLNPDGRSIVAGLETLGALAGNETLTIRPRWVAAMAIRRAAEELYADVPDGLGALLVSPDTSSFALRRLIFDVEDGALNLAWMDESDAEPTPERLATCEGYFRAVGMALADDTDIDVSDVKKVWDLQMRYVGPRSDDLPVMPLLMLPCRREEGIASKGVWFASAIAITRLLVGDGVAVPASLNPWNGTPKDEDDHRKLLRALSMIRPLPEAEKLNTALFDLGSFLLDAMGPIRGAGGILDIQQPDALVLLTLAKLKPERGDIENLCDLPFPLSALEGACTRRGANLDGVLRWCWQYWGKSLAAPPVVWLRMGRASEDLRALWRAAPPELLSDNFCEWIASAREVWPYLDEAKWRRWLEWWSSSPNRWGDEEMAFAAVPAHLALAALRDGRISQFCRTARQILWERMPQELAALIDELDREGEAGPPERNGPLELLVTSAPESQTEALVERAESWLADLNENPSGDDWVRKWLLRVVDQRMPGWRKAVELLVRAHIGGPAQPR